MHEEERLMNLLKSNHIFLTGGGGVGKSYLCNKIIKNYRQSGNQVVVLGSTGISAVHVGGQTIHSFFAFGIASNVDEMRQNDKNRNFKNRIREINLILSRCDLLVIDEISMVSSELMEMIRYRVANGGFEGRVLLVGDFFQLPPVNKRSSNTLWGDSLYAFESIAWEFFNPLVVMLCTPKRTKDRVFFSILNRIRDGRLDDESVSYLQNLRENTHLWEEEPTVLFGTNHEADIMNKKRLEAIESELITLKSNETIHKQSLHVKKLESFKKVLPVADDLELKVGAYVLFCTNKHGSYYNGQRGIVESIEEDEIAVRKDDGIVRVERHEFTLSENVFLNDEVQAEPLASIKQFPLKLAYAITIHKSQGMSIETLVCNIDKIFETSQFYVALSRAKEPKNLLIHYSYTNFLDHIQRCVRVDERVREFYRKSEVTFIEDDPGQLNLF